MNHECRQGMDAPVEPRSCRVRSLTLSGLCLIGLLQAGCATRSSAPTPLQQLQGTWSGIAASDSSNSRYTIRVVGDSFHFYRDTNFWFDTTIQLPAGTDPQQLHATIRRCAPGQESSVDNTVAAIFRIEAGTLVLATHGDGAEDVPTGFDPSQDKRLTRYDLTRVQAPR